MSRAECYRVERVVALAAGSDLAGAESDTVERHAAECPACRLLLQELADTMHTVRDLPALRISSDEGASLRRSVWRRLEVERGLRPRPAPPWRPGWAAAGAALSLLVAFAVLLPRGARDGGQSGAARRGEVVAPHPIPFPPGVGDARPPQNPPRSLLSTSALWRRPARRRSSVSVSTSAPVRIEFSTPDPDVRIVWLVGSRPAEPLPPLDPLPTMEDSE